MKVFIQKLNVQYDLCSNNFDLLKKLIKKALYRKFMVVSRHGNGFKYIPYELYEYYVQVSNDLHE